MDWNMAIERNREALKRIVAMLVTMATIIPMPRADARAEDKLRGSLPRHLHRAILRLLRPAESAVRRLVIVVARGLVVTLPPPRLRKAKTHPTIQRNGVGTGIVMPSRASPSPLRGGAGVGVRPRTSLCLPLLDPLRHVRMRRTAVSGVPRISLPGVTAPFPVAPRHPPAPDDRIDATRLSLRLKALGIALEDLPAQARRFARWQARSRAPAAARDGAGQGRRVWPLRPGRPPGQRAARRPAHEVHDILNGLHGLAFDVLEHPDTS